MKILTKEILRTFSYTTSNTDREGNMVVRINGRTYIKFGTFQAVTLVGDLCKVYDADVKSYKTVLFVGVSRQHPRDIKVDKELAYEIAHTNALLNPCMIIEVGECFTRYNFKEFAKNYIDTLKLEFVKTVSEIEEDDFMNFLDGIEFSDDTNNDINDCECTNTCDC